MRSGEGVLGLRRAFAIAGARSLLMSLWKVADAPTQALMTAFYRRLSVNGGVDKMGALRAAQLERLRHYRTTSGHSQPLLWGAFILAGE